MVMQVELVVGGTGNGTTGLSRYSSALFRELKRQKTDVELIRPNIPFGKTLASLGRGLNLDPITFFSNYPVAVDSHQADVYHLASENLASLLMFRKKRPVVITVHAFFTYFLRKDPNLAMYNHVFHRLFDNLAMRGLYRADAIIAVSHYVADLLRSELKLPEDRIHVIHEAVDHDFFRPIEVPETFREDYGLDPNYFYFLFVGSEQPRKNFLSLIEAFAEVRAKYESVRLLKIGAAELQSERERALKRIHELGIEDDVIFMGHIGDELPLLYNACDVFVFPSLYEGFGFPPLEAMACGTPTICSNTSSLPEVVSDAALSVSPDDQEALAQAMQYLLENPAVRKDFRKKGLERAASFSWDETVRQTIRVYEQLLESKRKSDD